MKQRAQPKAIVVHSLPAGRHIAPMPKLALPTTVRGPYVTQGGLPPKAFRSPTAKWGEANRKAA